MSDPVEPRVKQLEENIAQLRGEYASSWALHTKNDFTKIFSQEIRNEIQGKMLRWSLGLIALLAGSGVIFIKYTVIQTFKEENSKLVRELYQQDEAQAAALQENFQWSRFHDYGKDQVYLATLYGDSPVEPKLKVERIGKALDEAEHYFLQSLQHGTRHASTYWELGELAFTYPLSLSYTPRIDINKAIQRYQQAADRYTQPEIDAGWRAEAYLRIGKAYLYSLNQSPENRYFASESQKMLLKAKADFASIKNQSSARTRDGVDEVQELLSELEKTLAK
ncbi:MAG TPA: hypothetical protein VIT23_11725 [Terrimicrobiaceae bacterium]